MRKSRFLIFIIFFVLIIQDFCFSCTEEKILILSKHTPNLCSYHEFLPEYSKDQLYLVCTTPVSEEIKTNFSSYYVNIVEKDIEELVDYAKQLRNIHQFSYIVAPYEDFILIAAELRSYFNLAGQSLKSAQAYKNKIIMKNIITSAGIRCPKYKEISSEEEIVHFFYENNQSIVVKPIDQAGSKDTYIIDSVKNLTQFLNNNLPYALNKYTNLLVEEYITGEMYHINGIFYGGNIIASWPSKYFNNCIDFINGKPLGDFLLEIDNPLIACLKEYADSIIKIMPSPPNFCFHLEVFISKNNEIIFCEVGSRVGGGKINLAWKRCMGIDLQHEFIRMQSYLPLTKPTSYYSTVPQKLFMELCYPYIKPKPFPFKTKPFDWIIGYKFFDYNENSKSSTLQDISILILFEGASEKEINNKLCLIQEEISKRN